jgi:hypothetical protein
LSAGRVVAAGLAAGAANLVVGFGFAHLVGVEKFQALLRSHNLRAIGEPSDAIPHVLVRLLIGVVVTTLFVCLAPRFGGGPRAAIAAAAFGWTFLYAYTAWGHVHIGLFPLSWGYLLAGWGVLEMIVTALVGGWIATGRGFWV